MAQRHKHADLIHAWAEGAEIEYLSGETWVLLTPHAPLWFPDGEYRIKPEKKPDVARRYHAYAVGHVELCTADGGCRHDNLCLTFSGDTGKLIKAEVL